MPVCVDDDGTADRVRMDGDYKNTPYDHAKIKTLLTNMKAAGAILDATLFVFTDDKQHPLAAPWSFNVTRLANQLGVKVDVGTDDLGDPQDPFPNLHFELELLVSQCGFTPMQAIQAVTRTNAEVLGIDTDFGTVEVGKVGDLVVLSADPLRDIRNTRQIVWVVKEGALFKGLAHPEA